MTSSQTALLNLLAEDSKTIAYRPQFAKHFGSVTAAILFQQIYYRWSHNKQEAFYKFKEPCAHKLYREGDSWCEELAFGRREFDNALKVIGQKISKGTEKDQDALVYYWTSIDRVTYYEINDSALRKVLNVLYGSIDQNEGIRKVRKRRYEEDETAVMNRPKPPLDYNIDNNRDNNRECVSAHDFSEFVLKLDEVPTHPAQTITEILQTAPLGYKDKWKREGKIKTESDLKDQFFKFAEWRTNRLVEEGKEFDLFTMINKWKEVPRGAYAAFYQSWVLNMKNQKQNKPQAEEQTVFITTGLNT